MVNSPLPRPMARPTVRVRFPTGYGPMHAVEVSTWSQLKLALLTAKPTRTYNRAPE